MKVLLYPLSKSLIENKIFIVYYEYQVRASVEITVNTLDWTQIQSRWFTWCLPTTFYISIIPSWSQLLRKFQVSGY